MILRRLEARGLRVLVERPVSRAEFPEYAAFDPYEAGAPQLGSHLSLRSSKQLL